MAIIIPSKNIYEINNQKVVDNEVDNIEVEAKNASIISDTKIVYDESIDAAPKDGNEQTNFSDASGSPGGGYYRVAIAYLSAIPKYDTVNIQIPKHIGNSGILRILTGLNADGIENIKYSLRGIVKKGEVSGSGTWYQPIAGGTTFRNVIINEPTNVITTTDTQFSVSKNIEYTYDYLDPAITVSATVNLPINSIDNISSAKTTESPDGNSFILHLVFLSGIKIRQLGGGDMRKTGEDMSITLSGEYEEYIPTQIDVSFYGDTISLDLQDETVKIGDGQHVYSFSGNELIQKTNTPSIEENYNKVINGWKSGRETAVLRCSIDEYLSEKTQRANVTILENKSTENGFTQIRFYCSTVPPLNKMKSFSWTIKIGGTAYALSNIDDTEGSGYYKAIIQKQYVSGDIPINIYAGTLKYMEISASPLIKDVPMTLQIGSIVCPYIMNAKGIDVPMSLYKNGDPKEFIVIGKNVIYDGAPYQEITIQEIYQTE